LEGIKELFFTFMEESYYKRRKQEIKQRKQEQGRPSRKDLAKNSPGGRGKPGRPKGDATIINEYKARMLASPKSKRVLDTIFEAEKGVRYHF
jgi:hypothetical protein